MNYRTAMRKAACKKESGKVWCEIRTYTLVKFGKAQ